MRENIELSSVDMSRALYGSCDRNLKLLREAFGVDLTARETNMSIIGNQRNVQQATDAVNELVRQLTILGELPEHKVQDVIRAVRENRRVEMPQDHQKIRTFIAGKTISPKTAGQAEYIRAIFEHDIVFGVGPAGTGKTYLAVAMAVSALKEGLVRKIVLVRPAVEAGERLGFLPGDIREKVNPYLQPVYDGLGDMMDPFQMERFIERNVIEIAPLAFMRGRTLSHSFIILDEAQNTSPQQMKMFLTRLGLYSKTVITGDITQVDLPPEIPSGMIHAMDILRSVQDIKFIKLSGRDIVRHRLVQEIVRAYEIDAENKIGGGVATPNQGGAKDHTRSE